MLEAAAAVRARLLKVLRSSDGGEGDSGGDGGGIGAVNLNEMRTHAAG